MRREYLGKEVGERCLMNESGSEEYEFLLGDKESHRA